MNQNGFEAITTTNQIAGQELPFVTIDNSESPSKLLIAPTFDDEPQVYELKIESENTDYQVHFVDTINVTVRLTFCDAFHLVF